MTPSVSVATPFAARAPSRYISSAFFGVDKAICKVLKLKVLGCLAYMYLIRCDSKKPVAHVKQDVVARRGRRASISVLRAANLWAPAFAGFAVASLDSRAQITAKIKNGPSALALGPSEYWLRGQDLNLRPSGYEPDELPDCSTPRLKMKY